VTLRDNGRIFAISSILSDVSSLPRAISSVISSVSLVLSGVHLSEMYSLNHFVARLSLLSLREL